MQPNPFEPPAASPDPRHPVATRTPLLLAALGAWGAAAYWALLTALIALGAAMGAVSPTALILPIVLIGLYVLNGVRMFKGEARAVRSLLWLHGVGCLVAIIQVATSSGLFVALQAIKVVIHIFGVATVVMARRHVQNTWLQ